MQQTTEMKCSVCGVSKPLDAVHFYFHKRRKQLVNPCKECTSAKAKERYAKSHVLGQCTRCRKEQPIDAFPKQAGIRICFACRENPPDERVCSICSELKSTEEFEKGRGRNQCKECRKALHQKRIDLRANSSWACTRCNLVKPAGDFHHGVRVCKNCTNRNRQDRRLNDPVSAELDRERSRQYYANHTEQARQSGIERWERTPRPCKLCDTEKLPKEFVRNRQICLDCNDAPVRTCTSCREDKPAEDFQAKKFSFTCRACRNEQAQRQRAANPERVKKNKQKHRSKPGYRQKVNASKKKRYQKEPDYAEQQRERARYRRAQKAGVPIGDVPPDHKHVLIEAQGGKCPYCGKAFQDTPTSQPHLDHYIPLAKDGQHSADNLKLVLCAECNVRKGDQDPQKFVQEKLGWLFDLALIPTVSVKTSQRLARHRIKPARRHLGSAHPSEPQGERP